MHLEAEFGFNDKEDPFRFPIVKSKKQLVQYIFESICQRVADTKKRPAEKEKEKEKEKETESEEKEKTEDEEERSEEAE